MTDLRGRFEQLLQDEPPAPYDVERIVAAGRRARRRHNTALATAGTLGAAGLTATVVMTVMAAGGGDHATVNVGVQPSPSPTPSAAAGKCYLISATPKEAKLTLARLARSGKVGASPSVKSIHEGPHNKTIIEVCAKGASAQDPQQSNAGTPAGPPYHYTEEPRAIADRLGGHLHDRVTNWGLTIAYTRPFAQESSTLDSGHPSYFDGNVDVRESNGYGDIGVQVNHTTSEQVPFDGACNAADNCVETTLADGSVLRTGQVKAGRGLTVMTAEVHRPDGVVVQAQMSNYAFGPEAGSEPKGDQPLTLDQLVSLAEDKDFSF